MIDTIKFNDKGNCKMVAHRGISGIEKENTCPAFVIAGTRTYFGIETDVHVTKDGKFVISHDSNIQRVSGVNLVIEESTLEEIRKVKIFDTDGVSYRSDLIFPVLDDYLKICKKFGKIAVLELKEDMTRENIKAITETVAEEKMEENIIYISFFKNNLLYLKNIKSDAKIQFLCSEANEDSLNFIFENGFDIDCYYNGLTKEKVALIHQKGLKVNCWTVDDLENAKKMIEYGVDYITSNILE